MERELLFAGIGGQGIQLMTKVLADAAAGEGKYAMLFGVYHRAMRGSPSGTTLVIGDAPIEAPPIGHPVLVARAAARAASASPPRSFEVRDRSRRSSFMRAGKYKHARRQIQV